MLRTVSARFTFALAWLGCLVAPAWAGGGSENTIVVINAKSWASITVANHYIALRQIPPLNVIYLDWPTGIDGIDGKTLREQILMPVLNSIEKRGLYSQVDCIVYSSDFPTAIDLSKDFPPTVKFGPGATPTCSLNAATYLWTIMFQQPTLLFDPHINHYMRTFVKPQGKFVRQPEPASSGFRSWYGWGNAGERLESGGQAYMLSTVLAVTSGRGNSVREAINYLTSSAGADGTFPKGTIYFTRTSDVRSTTRDDEVQPAISELAKLGVKAKVVTTAMPNNAGDVQGLLSGVASFSWAQTRSTIKPGAICDNLTSFGGIMNENSSQTPLTEFLRYGAAGAAGTVVEPLAVAEKFASPNIFVHYARGCSLAESYYQALFAPLQVLIVGDPLCQPWADIPKVQVSGVQANQEVRGTLSLDAKAEFAKGGQARRFELFVDGRRAAGAADGAPLVWDSTTECDGFHELKVVAIADGPIETQGRATIPVTLANQGRSATLATRPAGKVRWDEKLVVGAKATGAQKIHVLNNGRLLGSIDGEQGQLTVDPKLFGLGPTRLQAIAALGAGYLDRVLPKPVELVVEPPPPLVLKNPPDKLVPGLVIKLPKGDVVPIQSTAEPNWLSTAGIGPREAYTIQGFFEARTADVYQFQVWHDGSLKLVVDGTQIYDGQQGDFTQRYVPVNLAAGTHRLTAAGTSGSDVKLKILFGGPGAKSLDGRTFRHPPGK